MTLCYKKIKFNLKRFPLYNWMFQTASWARLFFFFCYFVCEAIGSAVTPGLLCQPRVMVKIIVERQMECRLAGETEVLGKNLPQRHIRPSQNPT
jgi:hypothetical protein